MMTKTVQETSMRSVRVGKEHVIKRDEAISYFQSHFGAVVVMVE